ncbi:hypothetical protein Q31b_58300 [Novipirellula aureliae]|uniref:Uncharacterized protein n=2 Tax=Novipirellula aureliae TaxID=2527966 RepID=A0A5C6D691_9BACT|nr:hypothetical protein Q31b_58300 [Novipirellula aureliae]
MAGCIGVTRVTLGYPSIDEFLGKLGSCYASEADASSEAKRMTKDKECCNNGTAGAGPYGGSPEAMVVWVQFSNDSGIKIPEKDGVFDLSGSDIKNEILSPVGGIPGNPNYDFKVLMDEFKQWLGANHGGPGMNVSFCENLTKDIETQEKVESAGGDGLETNFYCPVCQRDYAEAK